MNEEKCVVSTWGFFRHSVQGGSKVESLQAFDAFLHPFFNDLIFYYFSEERHKKCYKITTLVYELTVSVSLDHVIM